MGIKQWFRSEFELSISYLGKEDQFYAFRNICLHYDLQGKKLFFVAKEVDTVVRDFDSCLFFNLL